MHLPIGNFGSNNNLCTIVINIIAGLNISFVGRCNSKKPRVVVIANPLGIFINIIFFTTGYREKSPYNNNKRKYSHV